MKRSVLLMLALSASLSFGQTIKDNKLSFNFVQLPTNPIAKEYTSFNVLVERKYEQANEDSLVAYQTRLDQATMEYEAQMVAWREKRKQVMRTYYQNMATWQKQVNAGSTTAQKPADPIIPVQPIMEDVEPAHLHSELNEQNVINAINLAGYSRGDGGATITIGVHPLSDVHIKMTQKQSGTVVKYTYTATYRLPLDLKVEDPSSGVVLQTMILNNQKSYQIGQWDSQYEFDLWWLDNKDQFWTNIDLKARNGAFSDCNTIVNNKCGYPVKSRSIEIYTVKKFKDHTYDDLTNAYTAAMQGYQAIGQSKDRSTGAAKLNEAVAIWKQVLTESNPNDKKARVNDKVTSLCYANLAHAHVWLNDFDNAEMYMNQAIAGGGKFKRAMNGLAGFIQERRLRYNTNF